MILKKRIISGALLILISVLLTGCFNYRDINKVTFATSMIFDIDDLNTIQLYVESIKPFRSTNDSSDKGRRIIYRGQGKTVLEAIRDINMASSNNINFSQNRAYVFTEKAAKYGLNTFLDLINNSQEFQIKPTLYVYYGNVQELLEVTSNDEEYLGTYLSEMTQRNSYNPTVMESNINSYLNNSLIGSKTNILTSIEVRKDALDKKIELAGASIIRDNRLIDKLNIEETFAYNLLMGNLSAGTLEVPNPQEKDTYITLEITQANNECELIKSGDSYQFKKLISIKTTLGESQGRLIVDEKSLDEIRFRKEDDIKEYLMRLYTKFKEESLDIFGIQREKEIKLPFENIDKIIEKTNLDLDINIVIDGRGTIKNTL